ncbi:MAG: PEP-utilizing enzyme [Bacteroidetes bacterium]|nr:PEP-utilizing enzyme [Bacteroidota bacterium]
MFTPRSKSKLTFKKKFLHFQGLLASNDEAHRNMSEMAEMLTSGKIFSKAYANKIYRNLIASAYDIARHLVILSSGKYQQLISRTEELEEKCKQILSPRILCPEGWDCPDYNCQVCDKVKKIDENIPYYYPLNQVDDVLSLEIGTKMSHLGEISKKLQIPIPDGFCLTVRLFEDIMIDSDLRERKDEIFHDIDFDDIKQVKKACQEAQELFISTPIPEHIKKIILDAYNEFFGLNNNVLVSVRSSAIGEDSANYSFAGLHLSALNVSRENLVDAVYEVLISKYSPQSVVYRYISGLRDEDMPMSVGCLKMVNANAAGVIFTTDPIHQKDVLIINAVKGLGTVAVSGRVSPQVFILDKNNNFNLIGFSPGMQDYKESPKSTDGLEKVKLDDKSVIPCLNEIQLKELADYATLIEQHYGSPQDIEWVIDENNKILILQARQLQSKRRKDDIIIDKGKLTHLDKTYKILLNHGDCASTGIATGKVFSVNNIKDINDFPKGSIVVSKKNLPEFTSLIHKASGFITDVGSTTGHLSIIAREQNIPVITNTINGTEILKNGMVITLFADASKVYEGKVDELIEVSDKIKESDNLFLKSPLYRLWHGVSKFVFKLNLTNPNSAKFSPEYCLTYHDIIRFAHEVSMKEMFAFYETARVDSGKTYKLKFEVPLNIYVIDLGGGIKSDLTANSICVDEIKSKPFLSLIKGMTTQGIEWGGPLSIDAKGFLNIMMTNLSDPHKAERDIGSRSYALISDNYLNFFSRLGYHFSRLDALASNEVNNNYINFHFRGGAADQVRKERRAKAITRILESLHFTVIHRGDTVISNIRKIHVEDIHTMLEVIGRLMGAVRNTDVTMLTDNHVDVFVNAFLNGDPAPVKRFYTLEN